MQPAPNHSNKTSNNTRITSSESSISAQHGFRHGQHQQSERNVPSELTGSSSDRAEPIASSAVVADGRLKSRQKLLDLPSGMIPCFPKSFERRKLI